MTSLLRALIPEQQRAVDASTFGLASEPSYESTAGVSVTQETALSLSAVYGAARLLSNDIGTLPMTAFRQRTGRRVVIDPQPTWIDEPNPWNPNESGVAQRSQVVASLVLDGNAFIYAVPNVFAPAELHVLDPQKVEVKLDRRGTPAYVLSEGDNRVELSPANCLHVTLFRVAGSARGMSPIEAMRRGIGRGMAAEEAGARLFGQGSLISGLVEYPKEAADPDPDQVKEMLRGLNRRHKGIKNAWALGALTGGATFHELTLKPRDAQAIETEEWTLEQFARTLGIPPSMLGSQKPGAVAYASVEQRAIDYSVHAAAPITTSMEAAYSRLLPRGSFVKINLMGLLRGDQKARYESYQIALQNKWMTRDEVRGLEDMEPLGLGFLETPNNNAPESPAEQPEEDGERMVRNRLSYNTPAVRIEMPEWPEIRMPNIPPAQVTVNVPEQPAPIVNVSPPEVHVSPPEVNVNVEPAEVRFEVPNLPQQIEITSMPRRLHIAKRGDDGKIVGSIEEDEAK